MRLGQHQRATQRDPGAHPGIRTDDDLVEQRGGVDLGGRVDIDRFTATRELEEVGGEEVSRIFVAHVAITAFDHAEFILRREVTAAPEEREWLDQPRGLDRHELIDPNNVPPGYPPARPKPSVYNEVWELAAQNVVLRAVGV